MESSLRNVEEEVKRWRGTRGFINQGNRKRRNAWHFGNSKAERCGADRAFFTAGPWDWRRRERRLFVNSSHSQTPNQILSLNLPGQNVWTRTHTAERNIIRRTAAKMLPGEILLWMGSFLYTRPLTQFNECGYYFRHFGKVQTFSNWIFQKCGIARSSRDKYLLASDICCSKLKVKILTISKMCTLVNKSNEFKCKKYVWHWIDVVSMYNAHASCNKGRKKEVKTWWVPFELIFEYVWIQFNYSQFNTLSLSALTPTWTAQISFRQPHVTARMNHK